MIFRYYKDQFINVSYPQNLKMLKYNCKEEGERKKKAPPKSKKMAIKSQKGKLK
jgi:hypothetical protein